MYWHELNEKRIGQLRYWLRGKRVIIIGNSVRMMNYRYGEMIDSYDVVVRLGKGLTDSSLHAVLGTKTDVWFSGMFRSYLYDKVDCKWKILTISCSAIFDDGNLFLPLNKCLFGTKFQPYRDFFWADSVEGTRKHWESQGFNEEIRPSQGIICCDFFARRLKHDKIDVIGFDFFNESLEVNGVSYTSWHMPQRTIAKYGKQEIPHGSDLERNSMNLMMEKYGVRLLPYQD